MAAYNQNNDAIQKKFRISFLVSLIAALTGIFAWGIFVSGQMPELVHHSARYYEDTNNIQKVMLIIFFILDAIAFFLLGIAFMKKEKVQECIGALLLLIISIIGCTLGMIYL